MDGQLKSPTTPTEGRDVVRGGMPFERPIDMPVQDLRQSPQVVRALGPAPIRAIVARAIVILATLGLTGYALFEMLGIVEFSKMTILQGVMIFFFTVTFAWIAFSAASAIAGLLVPIHIPKTQANLAGSRTALLMPIYNEDPTHTTSALQAMAEALAQAGAAQHFEIVIISDSTQVDPWINESLAVDRLRRE